MNELRTPRAAHHDPRGGFRNPWPSAELHGTGSLLKWMITRGRRPERGSVPEHVESSFCAAPTDDPSLAITWIGHSTFLVESQGVSVLTDPIWSSRASPFRRIGPHRHSAPAVRIADLPPIDTIFISHDHYDHLDDHTVLDLIHRFPQASWIVPLGVGSFLARRGATSIVELDWWQASDIGPITAFCTPAQHFSGRLPWSRNSTLWCGWVIKIGSHRIFFAGDTGLHPEFGRIAQQFGPFDAVILPIGAYEPRWFMQPVHMSPADAVSAYQNIASHGKSGRCVFIPSHWGTFRLTDEPLDEPPRLLRQAWSEAGLAEHNLCLVKLGETVRRSLSG